MCARGGELVATNKPTVVSKLFLDAVVMEDSQSDRRFPDPPCADESDWSEGFCEANDLCDQLVASNTGPQRRGRWFSKYARCESKATSSPVVGVADLVRGWADVSTPRRQ